MSEERKYVMAQLESIKDTMLIRDRVYEALRKNILMGEFVPGEALNILGISKQMGVSCAPVREALNMLNKDGLVELMPYKKATVASGNEADYQVAFDLRLMLEPYALEHSVSSIPQEEIDAMRKTLMVAYDQAQNVTDYLDCDIAFHHMLYAYSDSKLLVSTLDNVRTYTMRYYARRFDMIVEAKRKLYQDQSFDHIRAIRDEIKEHLTILDVVQKRDGKMAAELLREHINADASLLK